MKIKLLFTIPNFDTAGSGRAMLTLIKNLDFNIFEPEIATLHRKGDFFNEVQQSGIKIHIMNLYQPHRPIHKLLTSCWKLSRELKKINPDIVHSYHYSSEYSEAIACKMAGIPWVFTKKYELERTFIWRLAYEVIYG